MPDVVDVVKKKVPDSCQVTRCGKEGCSLSMKGAPAKRVLIDLDSADAPIRQHQTRCDYIFVGQTPDVCVAALELKGGGLDASKVVAQLKAGAKLANRIVPSDSQVRFSAISVHGRRINPKQRDHLLRPRNQITFRNEKFTVKLARCGDTLASALRRGGLG